MRREKRLILKYLVEWEGWDEPTWEPADSLIEQGLQELIDEYEHRQLQANDDLELATVYTYTAGPSVNGVVSLSQVRV
jgi:Chromo (CHRromatin Organisation MOdifier) domain